MYKIAAIIAGVLLLAGAALAGTVNGLGSSDSPTLGSSLPTASTTVGQDDRGREDETRGRANEPGEDARGHENEPNEGLRGPCDEAEHANDPRCTGVTPTDTVTTRVDDDRRGNNRGHDGGGDHRAGNSGPGGGESGHGGRGGDD
jgi:hypothetical protein